MWTNLKGQDYSYYELLPFTVREKRWLITKSVFIILFLDYFFYQSIWAVIPLLGVGYWYYQLEKKMLFQKKKEQAREQFKELMLLAATGQKAGYSAENAFISGYQDMKALFGGDSIACQMINILRSGKENNIAFSELWQKIGGELQIAEIIEFAQVYEISQKSSGNLASVMEKTADIIIHKIETEKEIAVLLSARRLEQKIMNIMPFLILLYISITSPGYFNGMYHSFLGIVFMSVCLLIYLGACALSVRMISIEI